MDQCSAEQTVTFNQTTWKIEDTRLPRHRRVDQFSTYWAILQYGCDYLVDSVRELSASMDLNKDGRKKVYDFPIDGPSFSRHCSFRTTKPHGIILFLHDVGSSSWRQWRHVVSKFMDEPEFQDYKFWAPDLKYTGICEIAFLETVQHVNDVLADFASDNPNAFVYLIGHSYGARIAAMIETLIDVQMFRTMHFRYVSLSGFFGPSDMAETLVKDDSQNSFMTLWNKRQKVWNDLRIDVKHIFYASADNERMYPVSQTSFPKLDDGQASVDYKLVAGWDHYSLVSGLLESYLRWCCEHCRVDRPHEIQVHGSVDPWVAECYLAIDRQSQVTKDIKEQEACEAYIQFLLKNEKSIIWSRELLFLHFSHDTCIGDLITKGLQLLSTARTRDHQLLRNRLQQDINRWLRLPIPDDMRV
jgi:hypothetical protein